MIGGPGSRKRSMTLRGCLEREIASVSIGTEASGICGLELCLGHWLAEGVGGLADRQRKRAQTRCQVGKIIIGKNTGNHTGKLTAADSAFDHIGPGDERALEYDMLDQLLVVKRRGMQDGEPCGPDSGEVKTSGRS